MIYLGLGTSVDLEHYEPAFIQELGYYLARSGRVLRTGGFGPLDDNLICGVLTYCKETGVNIPSVLQIILPFSQYRHYSLDETYIHSFSRLDELIREKARLQGVKYYGNLGRASRFKEQMLSCCVTLVDGLDLSSPAKFMVTYDRNLQLHRGLHSHSSKDFFLRGVYNQLKVKQTEIFNLADPNHRARMLEFVKKEKQGDCLVSPLSRFVSCGQ